MAIEIIASYFPHDLKMMSRNTLSAPQPDSAYYQYENLLFYNNDDFLNLCLPSVQIVNILTCEINILTCKVDVLTSEVNLFTCQINILKKSLLGQNMIHITQIQRFKFKFGTMTSICSTELKISFHLVNSP